MSSTEWSRYIHDVVGVSDPPEEINDEVVRRMRERYAALPLIDGAVATVRRSAAVPLAVASSSNRPLIDAVLRDRDLASTSTDGLVRGGRARQALARRLPRGRATTRGTPSMRGGRGLANGIRAAHAAGMR